MIHVYCGDGKGKTTAATGLAARFAGSGGEVMLCAFLKTRQSAEYDALERLGAAVLCEPEQFGFTWEMGDEERRRCREANDSMLQRALEFFSRSGRRLLVLDEVTYIADGLCETGLIERLKALSDDDHELVFTGREPSELFTAEADYISEIRALRHPFERGVKARRGVEC
ncbi:MAG: cob(I)yrinic acid a,c-diamide adenosyltransferase [Ruminococcus sp.]|nr:cob(I)yrinic acid a,c-diamide adenosyltransferase [Ruminococcus sp.]